MTILDENNKYTKMQKEWYEGNADLMQIGNHGGHNNNPDYYNILISDVRNNPEYWKGKNFLDFGAGCGRNLLNTQDLVDWGICAGTDISQNNLNYTEKNYFEKFENIDNLKLYLCNGVNLENIPDNLFDFVMSTIVMEHICVYTIRFSLMKDIYRVMKNDGLFSFQMGYDPDTYKITNWVRYHDYYEDYIDAHGTNAMCDTIVSNPDEVIKDLTEIGFKDITYQISQAWSSDHQLWIFYKCKK